jgi:cyclic pyranopterin phosphate synthase
MIDLYNRTIDYMRISITDRCNLRCVYCTPQSIQPLPKNELLSYEEILRVCRAAAGLGIRFIKITGGEPLMRAGLPALIEGLKKTAGIEKVSLTTNGVLLNRYIDLLCAAGIDGVTISLDTLDPECFEATTGYRRLQDILEGVHASVERRAAVKINAVLIDNGGEPQWRGLAGLAETLPVDVRFIEMMPLGYGGRFKAVRNDVILDRIKGAYPHLREETRRRGPGPAVYYLIPGFKGALGFISALSHSFCHACNRIRLTADGTLKPCLCYAGGIDLKALLRAPGVSCEGIQQALQDAAAMKPESHCFTNLRAVPEQRALEKQPMSAIGG